MNRILFLTVALATLQRALPVDLPKCGSSTKCTEEKSNCIVCPKYAKTLKEALSQLYVRSMAIFIFSNVCFPIDKSFNDKETTPQLGEGEGEGADRVEG